MSTQDQRRLRELNHLLDTGPPSDNAGLRDYCAQLERLHDTGGDVKAALAGLCGDNQYTCEQTCGQLARKYQALMSNCAGCASYGIYSSALTALQTDQSACKMLEDRVLSVSQSAIASADPAAYSAHCQNLANADPQNSGTANGAASGTGAGAGVGSNGVGATTAAGSLNTNDPYGCATNPYSPACTDCSLNPNSPACRALASPEAKGGQAGFKEAQRDRAEDGIAGFNVGSVEEALNSAGIGERPIGPPGEAPTVKGIPNNSGGGIPGSEGGAGSPASLGGSGGSGGSYAGTPGYGTDVDQGYRSGGGYQPASVGANGGEYGGSGEYGNYGGMYGGAEGQAGRSGGRTYLGMDLKQFLPGGRLDPRRHVAGHSVWSQINPKEENIWRRISIKMAEKCRLGVLWSCR
ncbi:MAG: hypothetical protein AB7G93_11980 [Bdellovibrionales bacterium]